ncbi:signal peptidase I [Candidatus Woesearchaeota archaeon]|nr:signal peptidase I [Candidatus Woesearchaeota archaeon]
MAAAKKLKKTLKAVWKFLWNDNSVWSWLINAGLAFVIIKFLVYPGLGLALQTNHPVVAVISDSMQHQSEFGTWWKTMGPFYTKRNITEAQFTSFRMNGGFNKGDIIILKGKKPGKIDVGDVIVFDGNRPEPIIHRVVGKWESGGTNYFSTKGDRNSEQRDEEKEIKEDRIVGTAWLRVPYVGYVKIIFTDIIKAVRG